MYPVCGIFKFSVYITSLYIQVYYLNMGTAQTWEHYQTLLEAMGEVEERTEDVEIPSKRGDFVTRLGTKHAPLTTQLEFSKVLYIS